MPLSDNVSNQSLKIFLDNYEKYADNLKFEPLIDFIDKDAIYWFTNGTFIGIDAIRKEFERTWSHLKDETYTISDVQWLVETDDYAACIYRFSSNSRVNGKQHTYQGRGTNLFKKVNGNWKIIHEHLSKDK